MFRSLEELGVWKCEGASSRIGIWRLWRRI
jgi:hypothetical protein